MSVPGAVSADEELIHVREVLADVAVRVGADRIELFTGGAGIHGEYRVSFEAVSVPAQPDAIDMVDAVDVVERVRDLIHEFGFYAVEQAAADAADGADEEDEDRGGDDQPDDRVSQREAVCPLQPDGNPKSVLDHHGVIFRLMEQQTSVGFFDYQRDAQAS